MQSVSAVQQRCLTTVRSMPDHALACMNRKSTMMSQPDQNYVFLPQRLITDLQANPAAIGVYALLARLFLIYHAPIPLSAADLQRLINVN